MSTKIEKVIYQAHAKSTGGRDGTTRTSDGLLDLKLAVPKEMGKRGPSLIGERRSLAAPFLSTDSGGDRRRFRKCVFGSVTGCTCDGIVR